MLRAGIRVLCLLTFWLSVVPCLMWTYTYVQFFFVQPTEVQRQLFGRQVAGLTSLRAAIHDCCALTGDGRISWYYEMDDELAAILADACAGRRPAGVTAHKSGARPCLLEKPYPFNNPEGAGYSAEVVENRLGITQDWD